MITVANRDGFAAANVSSVIAEAGVSRPTFYAYFPGRDECFLAATGAIRDRLLEQVQRGVVSRAPEEAAEAALAALVDFAAAEPAQARFLWSETLAGGPRTLAVRDRLVSEIAGSIEREYARVPPTGRIPDVPGAVLIGACLRLLAARLRRGEGPLEPIRDGLNEWIASYRRPAGERRADRRVAGAAAGVALPPFGSGPLAPPPPLPPGRPRIPEDAVAENHRLRILFATAELVQRYGYTATTIAQITKLASVDGRVFYGLFADKEEAFSAAHEFGFQQLMGVTAGAFFAAERWPQRMLEALRALTQWVENNPALSHVGFVESYAVGPGAVQRVEDSLIAFTIFLQEGYQHDPCQRPPSRLGLEAIVTAVFEALYQRIRESDRPQIVGLLGLLIDLTLTPFLGAAETHQLTLGRLSEGDQPTTAG